MVSSIINIPLSSEITNKNEKKRLYVNIDTKSELIFYVFRFSINMSSFTVSFSWKEGKGYNFINLYIKVTDVYWS